MEIKNILTRIRGFEVSQETEDCEISAFFDELGESFSPADALSKPQKQELIDALFNFIKSQNPEMDENFSLIHFMEWIDKPDYTIYYPKLMAFAENNGTITSNLLLNRYANSSKKTERKQCINLLRSISENKNYSEYIRESALDFYKYQIEK